MLMAQQVGKQDMGAAHRGFHIFLADLDAQRQRVDEQAHDPVSTLAALHASEQHRAEDHILPPGELAEHPCPGQMAQTGRTHSQPSGVSAQTPGQMAIQSQRPLLDPAAIATHIEQPEGRRGLVHILQHPPEEDLVLLLAYAQPRLCN